MIGYKKIFLSFMFVFLFVLTSCDSSMGNNSGENSNNNNDSKDMVTYRTAYGITYSDYVGMVKLTVSDDVIVYLDIDEVFLPNVWAMETKADTLKDYVTNTTDEKIVDNNGLGYAKYIKIGEKILIGTPYTDAEIEKADFKRQVIRYYNAKWYVLEVLKGNAYVCDKLGAKVESKDLNSQGSFFKSSSLYWTTGESTWSKNIQLFSNALVGTSLKEEVSVEDGYIKVGDIVTSATLEGYMDYYNISIFNTHLFF